MSDSITIRPSFEPEATSVLFRTPESLDSYRKAVPGMKELIRKNREETDKLDSSDSRFLDLNVRK